MNKENKYFFSFCVGLVIGGAVGIIFFSLFISYRIENYHRKITYLNSIIEDQQVRLEGLENKLSKKKLIVKKIEVDIKFKNKEIEDELVAIELEKHIKEKFNNLIGKELDNLDGDILVQVVDNRIMKIKNKQYKVKVEKIIIAQNIKFCIQVEKVQSD
ncbi:hypothetical protein FDC22_14105 [Clostridium botulinum]|uniref:Sporulation membrane protein YtrI C-terminal domain-containing protein n=1 Tax=Clostridium botulinum (strain Okra / Type B1) TaxID=498213 RepID=B1IJF8_CLOBK|nr:hypothetical protein [Clostridium botulinum]ACA46020.1 conserved hypothetical protein [Clostridium botulinum B1 str. Okra]MBD5562620.1 hypothetical protein [Clostridium botulinum]MBD5565779.1 hypothetical protein [Clostridium botulinum]MBD5569704.1 hypothetical protein [Clostridium botulinum]MBD5573500.1 hypothetical protein [Clostridium botulinum]